MKNRLQKKYLLTHSPRDQRTYLILVNNELRSLTRNLRKGYEKPLLQNVKYRPKIIWQYINLSKKMCPNITELLCPDGFTVCSDVEITTIFNNYCSMEQWLLKIVVISASVVFSFTYQDTTTVSTAHSIGFPPVIDSLILPLRLFKIKLWNCRVVNLLDQMVGLSK